MTTRVVVCPASHELEVVAVVGETIRRDVLAPFGEPREFWIYQGMALTVKEMPPL